MSSIEQLPQKPPFLFLDEILEREEGKSILCSKKLTGEEDFFQGHFPGQPIMPGVLMSEACFQAGALLLAKDSDNGKKIGVVSKISNARFRQPVVPGQEMMIQVELTDQFGPAYFMKGTIKVADKLVMNIDFACNLVDSSLLPKT